MQEDAKLSSYRFVATQPLLSLELAQEKIT
jgi:hypothetical protein